ncbi:hypothetical protein JI735_10890 [Paenibacillus sonchi]|uniref:Uncharacterized protein n=1 Tax=Paenibacillus sonchi TaxID=373687 RepID=A0A974SEI2_9BACL|nr:hypothetical protein [Paenibacillus sonchi]QQZ62967.1 hypothetical protein JI735_10890 [Paenibacillus sonchi]
MHIPPPAPRQTYWNRMILNAFWLVLLVHLLTQTVICLSMQGDCPELSGKSYLIGNVLLPDIMILGTLLVLEAIYKRRPLLSEISNVAASHLIAIVMILNLSDVFYVKPLIMLIPLLVSMLYLRSTYLKATSILCVTYMILLLLEPSVSDNSLRVQNMIIAFILTGTALAGFALIARGVI